MNDESLWTKLKCIFSRQKTVTERIEVASKMQKADDLFFVAILDLTDALKESKERRRED